eukprot:scaffold321746_cov32-Tisochrysis_lutea.AAC.4
MEDDHLRWRDPQHGVGVEVYRRSPVGGHVRAPGYTLCSTHEESADNSPSNCVRPGGSALGRPISCGIPLHAQLRQLAPQLASYAQAALEHAGMQLVLAAPGVCFGRVASVDLFNVSACNVK